MSADASGGEAAAGSPVWWRRRRWQVTIGIFVTLLLVTGLGAYALVRHLNANITRADYDAQLTDRPTNEVEDGPRLPLDILVMGSDSREGDNAIDEEAADSERADVTILMHLSADRRRAYGVSLPRDGLVDRPDCTLADGTVVPGETQVMFNEAYEVGGAACLIQTVEQLTGVRIEHHVEIDFTGFKRMVDAIGGVEVCIPFAVNDPDKGIFLDAGVQKLDGDQSLDYVRERQNLSRTGDIGRMRRQQAFVASMAAQVVSADMLLQPHRLLSFLDAATASLTIDPGLGGVWDLTQLARQFAGIGLDNIEFVTVPFVESTTQPGRLEWTPEAEGLWERIRTDKPLGPYGEGAIRAADQPGSGGGPKGPGGPGPSTEPDAPDDQLEATPDGLCR